MNGSPTVELRPSDEFRRIAETLENRGYQAWAVGGAVRDALHGEERADWDLATDARPNDVRRIFRRTVPIGVEHGTVGVLGADHVLYEVTTFRRDIETDGRHAIVQFADSIDEDLSRRDFTINAVAWRPATEELRDPFGGLEDFRRKVLRAVGEPAERFAEDYLRVLRGLRFAGRFGLTIEENSWTALRQACSQLGRLSAERVREELMKVLADRRPSGALRLYRDAGALEAWYPEIAAVAVEGGRWELNQGAVDFIRPSRRLLRLARWLVPLGADPESREHQGQTLLGRLKFSNADSRKVLRLLRHYQPLLSPVDSSAHIRSWLSDVEPQGARDLFRLHFAEARASGASERLRYLLTTWRRVHEQILAAPPLRLSDLAISGDDLVALGVQQGPAVGVILDELHAEVLEEPALNEMAGLLERARELMEMARLGRRKGDAGPPCGEATQREEPGVDGAFDGEDGVSSDG